MVNTASARLTKISVARLYGVPVAIKALIIAFATRINKIEAAFYNIVFYN